MLSAQIMRQAQRAMEKKILFKISTTIDQTRSKSKRLPHRFIHNIVEQNKIVCPWLTYDKVLNYNQAMAKRRQTVPVKRWVIAAF